MGAEATNTSSDLKRLEFLRNYTGYYYDRGTNFAAYVYNSGRSYTQGNPTLDNTIKAIEEKVSAYGYPLISAVQDTSGKALKTLDAKVDGALVALGEAVDRQRQYHEKNIVWYTDAKNAYLKKIEEATEFLKKEGLNGTAKYAADVVLHRVDDAKKLPNALVDESKVLVSRVGDAWAKLAAHPAVKNLIDSAQPPVDFAWKKYLAAHDVIVATEVYHKAIETGAVVLGRVQQIPLYKAAAGRVYPVVGPYVDPALDKVTHSPYYNAVVDHLKPQNANGLTPNGTTNPVTGNSVSH